MSWLQINTDVSKALAQDKEMKRKLTSIYDTFIDELKQLPSDVGASLETEFGDVRSKLIINRDRLRKMDCTIVVAGETSAGKTSFLNLLLEKDVLPSCHLAATSIICRIHPIPPASKRYFEVHFAGKKFKKYTVSDRDDDDMIAMLKNEVTCRDAKYDGAIVDLYWQIPLLGENYHVTIVDTPGVGENEPMSEKLYKFLPNATAFVYILNSANAGGVQEDKLIQIFRKIYEIEGLEDLFRMDPRCVLFVCNKWDSVDERCRETSTTQQQVWDDTLPKLEKYIQRRNFPLEKNLFKMSTLQARRYLDSDMGYSETYQQVLGGLGRLVVASQVEHSNRHFWWISTICLCHSAAATTGGRAHCFSPDNQLEVLREMDVAKIDRSQLKRPAEDKAMRAGRFRTDAGFSSTDHHAFAALIIINIDIDTITNNIKSPACIGGVSSMEREREREREREGERKKKKHGLQPLAQNSATKDESRGIISTMGITVGQSIGRRRINARKRGTYTSDNGTKPEDLGGEEVTQGICLAFILLSKKGYLKLGHPNENKQGITLHRFKRKAEEILTEE
ncbi:hypothetical protein DPMN_041469 [Dreissena polymorpha]|uniref:Dynamin N-terminal domain-containing protein n=1 Tax=Dreissena polymorpha TaxID=45954 RepID=A0A9D4HW43_DREPO|nr:hypothetical protein DPMN_041469 [Dreissena polymorpha]